MAFQTLALTNSIHLLISILFKTQTLTKNKTATAEIPAIASTNALFAPDISIRDSATNQVAIVAKIANTISYYTCLLKRSFLEASK